MEIKEKIFNFFNIKNIRCFICNKLHRYSLNRNVVCCNNNFYYSIRFGGTVYMLKKNNLYFYFYFNDKKVYVYDKEKISSNKWNNCSEFYLCDSEKQFHIQCKKYLDNLIFI